MIERKRIASIDIVRGAVMVFMALDHVRDWVTNQRFRPEDLSKATPALFATRWITHFCAPTFFLLAGVGVGILQQRGKPLNQLSRFLFVRGVWLLILELVITPVGWQYGFEFIPAFAVVLWALGWAMLLMALLIHVPRGVLVVFSALLIAGHNLLDPIKPESFGRFAGLWHMLHVPGFMIPNVLFIAYPLIPWVAVMTLGYLMAALYSWQPERRQRVLLQAGVAAVILFVALRTLNGYGDPAPWSAQRSSALTVASFLNTQKYPPSLDYLLMTLGPACIALALTERAHGRVAGWLAVYGRVPLFFYVIHIFVAHALAILLAYVQGGELRRIQVINHPEAIPHWFGLPLLGVYAVWATVVLLLYLPCRRFARLKNTRTDWWLSYL